MENENQVSEPVSEPVVESVSEPVVESVSEPVVESVSEPVVESVSEPVVESEPVVTLVPSKNNISKYVALKVFNIRK